jgi:hypothetical protein
MKNKESIVLYQDWMTLTEMMNESDCRQFYRNLFLFAQNEEPLLNTPALKHAWDIVGSEMIKNKQKKELKRDIMKRNSSTNPKLKVPDIGSNTKSNIDPILGGGNGNGNGNGIMVDGNNGSRVDGLKYNWMNK